MGHLKRIGTVTKPGNTVSHPELQQDLLACVIGTDGILTLRDFLELARDPEDGGFISVHAGDYYEQIHDALAELVAEKGKAETHLRTIDSNIRYLQDQMRRRLDNPPEIDANELLRQLSAQQFQNTSREI